jgi:hypothetical protein
MFETGYTDRASAASIGSPPTTAQRPEGPDARRSQAGAAFGGVRGFVVT